MPSQYRALHYVSGDKSLYELAQKLDFKGTIEALTCSKVRAGVEYINYTNSLIHRCMHDHLGMKLGGAI